MQVLILTFLMFDAAVSVLALFMAAVAINSAKKAEEESHKTLDVLEPKIGELAATVLRAVRCDEVQ